MTDAATPEVTIVVRDREVKAPSACVKTEMMEASQELGVRIRESGHETERERPTMIR